MIQLLRHSCRVILGSEFRRDTQFTKVNGTSSVSVELTQTKGDISASRGQRILSYYSHSDFPVLRLLVSDLSSHPSPFKMFYAFLLLSFFTFFATSIAQLTDAATLGASIKSETGYSLLPECINQCVWDIGDNDVNKIGGDLAIHLSCGSPWVNGCYCRGESAAYAYSFLTSCFGYLCTTPAAKDIDSGISVYTSYCSAALGAAYVPNAVPEPAPADGLPTVLSTATRGMVSLLQVLSSLHR